MPKSFIRAGSALIIIVILLFGSTLVRLWTDWLWFAQLSYGELFSTPLKIKLLLGLAVAIGTFILLLLNLRLTATQHSAQPNTDTFRFTDGKLKNAPTKYTRLAVRSIMGILSLLTGLTAAASWETILKYFNRVPFGQADPIFGRDIGFYFFTLPMIQLILGLAAWIIIIALITAITIYGLGGALTLVRRTIQFEPRARIHILGLVALLFILTALRTWFSKIPSLLFNQHTLFSGANYTNLHANLPLLKLLTVLAALAALTVIYALMRKKIWPALYAITAYFVIAIVGLAYPWAIQKFIVAPNELVKETQPLEQAIAATRLAYGLAQVDERSLSGETTLTYTDIKNNPATLNNIRLWDREPLLDTFGQLQEIRTYYDFVSVDNDRYQINGDYRQVLLSPRELNVRSLPADTFINRHFVFTHGHGLTFSPVNEVTAEGLPVLFIKDIPPATELKTLKITQPEIYYGEISHEPIFVNTKTEELDYPAGDKNVFVNYQGEGGVRISNTWRKALFALRFRSLKMFLSNEIRPESRAVFYRNIHSRVRRILPFLRFDSDPYLVITTGGQLKWIQDAYTVSDRYPYSQYSQILSTTQTKSRFAETVNYIRNSVKIVIDAYDGSLQFYIADNRDPLIQTYAKIFPRSFLTLEQMPDDLRAHLRYPEDLFTLQTELYQTYHMKEAGIFYNKEDEWQIPTLGRQLDPMVRHLIMKLPGEEQEEFILMLPFTPRGKDNLAAWMVARSDGEHYGKLIVYKFPKQKLVFGPQQIQNRINQDADISKQITLWDQRGSEVIKGNLLVIPIEESLLYVQPLYLRAEGGRIPELKRVIVAYENRIAMEQTLDVALARIFSGVTTLKAGPRITPAAEAQPRPNQTPENKLRQARETYERALEAQRAGDWARYGDELKKLGKILEEITE